MAVSAGAFQACFTVAGLGDAVRRRVISVCATQRADVDWAGPLRGRRLFPVGALYPALLAETFGTAELERLKAGPEILIKVSRPPGWLPGSLATAAGLIAYQAEKKLLNPMHPRAGRWLGFEPHYVSTHAVETPEDLIAALAASSSVPPFMPVGRVGGRPALDGGLVDNVPVEPLLPFEQAGERTLVLATRHYPTLPTIQNRTYVQPSRRIKINKFSIRDAEGIARAHALGEEDGAAFAAKLGG